jgi:hypothetical protein
MALWIGLYPKPFFQILEQPVNQIVQTIQDHKSNPNAPVNAQAGTTILPTAAEDMGAKVIGSSTSARPSASSRVASSNAIVPKASR